MKLTITTRHGDVSDGLKEMARDKVEHLERYNNLLQHVELILSIENNRSEAEIIFTPRVGKRFVVKDESESLGAAINSILDKAERVLTKHKEKIKHKKTSGRHRENALRPEA